MHVGRQQQKLKRAQWWSLLKECVVLDKVTERSVVKSKGSACWRDKVCMFYLEFQTEL